MKPKSLIKFCKDNAEQILKSHDPNILMQYRMTCVLRPYLIPKEIENLMTEAEIFHYTTKSDEFNTKQDIPRALIWVKSWIKEK